MNTRISKACQECRQRKIRCTGERPCKSCRAHNTECVYRHLARVRKSYAQSVAASRGGAGPTSGTPTSDAAAESPNLITSGQHSRDEEIYHSVSATQTTARSGSLQIYYGASSNFAFLQQLHRSLLLDDGSEIATPGEVQEGGAGLDLFNQRSIFFGSTALNPRRGGGEGGAPLKWDFLPADLRELFLDTFFKTLYHILSFIREDQLRAWAQSIFDKRNGQQSVGIGRRSITLAILAVGAISTKHLDWAEVLYKAAKIEADDFDEVVNLHSVQFSLILAVYQNTMGRPNQSYLHLGSANRKAYAMGLHKDIYSGEGAAETDVHAAIQEGRTTMWCLYFHERWQAFSLGRICAVRRSDITCPFPEGEQFLAQSARLLDIAMQGAEMMYGNRRLSLWETWKAAESLHNELRRFAEETGLAFASRNHDQEASRRPTQIMTLTSFYYHTILITFRPFLIVAATRARQRRLSVSSPAGVAAAPWLSLAGDEMWLREACRYAVDASRDQLSFLLSSVTEFDICKRLRYNCFFIESCCAVLLYDSLMNKHTYSHNLEYIKAGLQTLGIMKDVVPGEPTTIATASIERILKVAHQKISGPDMTPANVLPTPFSGTAAEPTSSPAPSSSLTTPSQARNTQAMAMPPPPPQIPVMDSIPNGIDTWDQGIPQIDWGFDVFTADLNHFFPIDDSYSDGLGSSANMDEASYLVGGGGGGDMYKGPY